MLKHERISDIMKSLKTIIWVIGAMFLLVTCKKDPGYGIEDLKIVSDVVVGTNSATITGTYYYPGEIKVIKACITKGESAVGEYAVELNGKEFTVEITGLQPSTTYQYYYKVDHGASEPYVVPESREFTTQSVTIMDDMPTVQILEMLPIDSATCRVKCEVLDDGGSPVVERGICWNTHGNPTMADATVRCDSAGLGMYTVYMEQLSLGHQYYVRAYAQNATGVIGQSNVVDFEMSALPGMSIDVHVSCEPEEGGTTTGGGSYEVGTQCTVTATPNPGYTFVNWTENGSQVSSEPSYSFTVTVERNLVANFSAEAYIISVKIEPEEGGTATGAGGYAYGDTCRLVASPRTGYDFVSWTQGGSTVSHEAECSFIVIESGTYTAHFLVKSYTVTVTGNPPGGGSVNGGGTFEYGTTCTVHATPAEGYAFENWTDDDDVVSTSVDYSFTVTSNRSLKANFRDLSPNECNISVSSNPTVGGTVTGGGAYRQGQQCTVNAVAAEGYTFVNWTENGEEVSTNENWTFIVNNDRILIANFAALATLPIVTTSEVANITQTTAMGGGNVTADGGASVTERGICWSTRHNPTIDGNHASNGMGTGSYTVNMTGLTSGTTYYVRAYAINSQGTSYGSEVSFVTNNAFLPKDTFDEELYALGFDTVGFTNIEYEAFYYEGYQYTSEYKSLGSTSDFIEYIGAIRTTYDTQDTITELLRKRSYCIYEGKQAVKEQRTFFNGSPIGPTIIYIVPRTNQEGCDYYLYDDNGTFIQHRWRKRENNDVLYEYIESPNGGYWNQDITITIETIPWEEVAPIGGK